MVARRGKSSPCPVIRWMAREDLPDIGRIEEHAYRDYFLEDHPRLLSSYRQSALAWCLGTLKWKCEGSSSAITERSAAR
jgi:hypothetical protein